METSPITQDTIVAVSSPPGRSHRGLIRLSGPDTQAILGKLIDEPIDSLATRTLSKVHLKRPAMPALCALFNTPHSYTGQETAELQVPGNASLLERLLHLAIDAGARLAEPGEFTFRAYLAGKLDLTQAEGIAATIQATSDTQLSAARHLLNGELGSFSRELVDDLGTRLALVEAGIDFTDQEDVVPIGPGDLDAQLSAIETRLQELLNNSRSWGEVEALPWVVLVGAPSTGKSTLFNALLGRERAVIDPVPGTTRDVLCEPMRLRSRGGRETECMLVDIAGLDDAGVLSTPIDDQAQAAAHQAIERAELILHVRDVTAKVSVIETTADTRPTLKVMTKSDLLEPEPAPRGGTCSIYVSAETGYHIKELRRQISERLGQLAISVSAEMLTLQPRHEQGLRSALEEVSEARAQLAHQLDAHAIDNVELIAGHLRQALDELAALGGELTPDDVIGRVFATFCVGK